MQTVLFDDPQVLHNDDGVVVVRYRCVIVAYWYGAASMFAVERRARFDEQAIYDEGKVACITIIDPRAPQPTAEARARLAEISHVLDASSVSHAYLALGTGARAALVRAIITAVRWRSHSMHPEKVFGEDVEHTVLWTVEQASSANIDLEPEALSLAVGLALSARDADAPTRSREGAAHLPRAFGRYQLERIVGEGGMAEVFLATQHSTGGFEKTLVLKLMRARMERDPTAVDMFLREARLAARINDAHVVQVFDAGDVDGVHFIAMEHVEGLSLHALAKRAWTANREVPARIIASVCADAARGLQAAHELGLVHRDVSPGNILVGVDGVAKIADFGIARSAEGSTLTSDGVVRGKIAYMPPEQLRGEALDGRADLYALGATMFWLLTGERPFNAQHDAARISQAIHDAPPRASERNPEVPQALDDLVDFMLKKRADERPADGMTVARMLTDAGCASPEEVSAFVSALQ